MGFLFLSLPGWGSQYVGQARAEGLLLLQLGVDRGCAGPYHFERRPPAKDSGAGCCVRPPQPQSIYKPDINGKGRA